MADSIKKFGLFFRRDSSQIDKDSIVGNAGDNGRGRQPEATLDFVS